MDLILEAWFADFRRVHRTIRATSVCFALAPQPHVSLMQYRIEFHTAGPRSNQLCHKPLS